MIWKSLLMLPLFSTYAAAQQAPSIFQVPNGAGTLHTMVTGESEETVILLHGGPGLPGDLNAVVNQLSSEYRVIVFHQRGTALSPCPSDDYSMDAYLSDIDAIAAYFKIEKFHLFGHSWGGLYAQMYMERHPERLLSVFLCSPGSGTGAQWKQTQREVMKLNQSRCSRGQWMRMGWNNLLGMLGSDKGYARLFEQVMKNYNHGFVDDGVVNFDQVRARAINRTMPEITRYPELKGIAMPLFPITISYGDNDIYQASQDFVLQRYPSAQVHFIPRSGHIPWLHNPAAYFEVLSGHFQR